MLGPTVLVAALLAGAALVWRWYARTRTSGALAKAEHRAEAVDVRPQEEAAKAPADELGWASWAYAVLAVSPLICVIVHFANDADLYSFFDLIFYFSLAPPIAALALAFAQRKRLSGAEVGLYWLGAALGAGLAVMASSFQNSWIHFGSIVNGMGFILALVGLSAGCLAYWRRGRSSPTEIAFYWLGSVLWLGLTAKQLFTFNEWNLLNVTDIFYGVRTTGLLFALAVAAVTALVLLFYRQPGTVRGSEVGVYWLGFTLLALPASAWMFLGYQWNWYGAGDLINAFASGLLAVFVVALMSVCALVYVRRPVLSALEIACYWFGLTLTAMFAATNAGSLVAPAWSETGAWTTGNTIVLAAALAAAAAIAYWWSQRTLAIAHRFSGESIAWSTPRRGARISEQVAVVRPRGEAAEAEASAEELGWIPCHGRTRRSLSFLCCTPLCSWRTTRG